MQFSKTATQIKDVISNLPVATGSDDMEEAAALKDKKDLDSAGLQESQELPSAAVSQADNEESDPFGLNNLISGAAKDEKPKGRRDVTRFRKEEEEENRRFLKSQREALVTCLEIAARRYKVAWYSLNSRHVGNSPSALLILKLELFDAHSLKLFFLGAKQ